MRSQSAAHHPGDYSRQHLIRLDTAIARSFGRAIRPCPCVEDPKSEVKGFLNVDGSWADPCPATDVTSLDAHTQFELIFNPLLMWVGLIWPARRNGMLRREEFAFGWSANCNVTPSNKEIKGCR